MPNQMQGQDQGQEFDRFWDQYPKHRNKLAAIRAYGYARKNRATSAEILAGVSRLLAHLPAPRFIPYASTWLRAGGWMDDYADGESANKNRANPAQNGHELRGDCLHVPRCPSHEWHRAMCAKARMAAWRLAPPDLYCCSYCDHWGDPDRDGACLGCGRFTVEAVTLAEGEA